MSNYDEMVADGRGESANEYISKRWGQLHSLEESEGEQILRYLFLVNSGGAIGVLSFIGAIGLANLPSSTTITLFSFGLGVILIGFAHAVRYYHFSSAFNKWQANTSKFYKNEIDWQNLLDEDEEETKSILQILVQVLCWTSFLCFIVGCINSGVTLYNWEPTPLTYLSRN